MCDMEPKEPDLKEKTKLELQEAQWIDVNATDADGNTPLILAIQANRLHTVRLVLLKSIKYNHFVEVLHKQNHQGDDANSTAVKYLSHDQLAACMSLFEEMTQLEKKMERKRRRHSLHSRTSSRALLFKRASSRSNSAHASPKSMFQLNMGRRSTSSSTKDNNGRVYKSVRASDSRDEPEDKSADTSDVEPEFEVCPVADNNKTAPGAKASPLQRGRSDGVTRSSTHVYGAESSRGSEQDEEEGGNSARQKHSLPSRLGGESNPEDYGVLRPPLHADMPTPQASLLLSLGDKLRNLMHTRRHGNRRDYRAASTDGRRRTITALDSEFSSIPRYSYGDDFETSAHNNSISDSMDNSAAAEETLSSSCPVGEQEGMKGKSSKSGGSAQASSSWRPSTAKYPIQPGTSGRRATTSYGTGSTNRTTDPVDEFHGLMNSSTPRADTIASYATAGNRPSSSIPNTQHVQFDEDLNTTEIDEVAPRANTGDGNTFKKRGISVNSFKIFRSRASSEGRHRHRHSHKNDYEGEGD